MEERREGKDDNRVEEERRIEKDDSTQEGKGRNHIDSRE